MGNHYCFMSFQEMELEKEIEEELEKGESEFVAAGSDYSEEEFDDDDVGVSAVFLLIHTLSSQFFC